MWGLNAMMHGIAEKERAEGTAQWECIPSMYRSPRPMPSMPERLVVLPGSACCLQPKVICLLEAIKESSVPNNKLSECHLVTKMREFFDDSVKVSVEYYTHINYG